LGRNTSQGLEVVFIGCRVGGRLGRWIRPLAMGLGVGVRKRVEPGIPRPIQVQGDCIGNVMKRREMLAGVRD